MNLEEKKCIISLDEIRTRIFSLLRFNSSEVVRSALSIELLERYCPQLAESGCGQDFHIKTWVSSVSFFFNFNFFIYHPLYCS